ncbi:MAG: outer membrane beta-barrel protein [Pseudomonadota bacterium]
MKKSLIAFAALGLSTACYAAEPGGYIGISLGQSTMDSGVSGVTGTGSLEEDGNPYKVYGGYNFGNNWSVEGSYINLGVVTTLSLNSGDTFNYEGITYITLVDGVRFELDGSVITLGAKYTAQLNNKFSVYGKASLASYSVDNTLTAPTGSSTDNNSGTDITVGIGASFAINEELAAHLDYDTYGFEGGDTTVNIVSLGMSYAF